MASSLPTIYESYPFIAPERFAGKLNGKVVSHTGVRGEFQYCSTDGKNADGNIEVIVTGSSSGIGIATSKAFAAAGAKVACVARSESNLNTVVDEIKLAGGKAIAVVADVGKAGAPKQIISKVEAELGPIDILVNNAGIARIGAVIDESEDMDVWWRVYEVNVRAPVAMIRAVLPSMQERNTGIVMSVSSGVATMTLPAM